MIIFCNQLADLLAPLLGMPVFSDLSGVQDANHYALLTLETSSELHPGSRTFQLDLSLSVIHSAGDLTDNNLSDYAAVCSTLDSAVLSLFSSFRKYSPLPGQPENSPLLLDWFNTPPELSAENHSYTAETKITLAAQF